MRDKHVEPPNCNRMTAPVRPAVAMTFDMTGAGEDTIDKVVPTRAS